MDIVSLLIVAPAALILIMWVVPSLRQSLEDRRLVASIILFPFSILILLEISRGSLLANLGIGASVMAVIVAYLAGSGKLPICKKYFGGDSNEKY
jgi:hypothetical protein